MRLTRSLSRIGIAVALVGTFALSGCGQGAQTPADRTDTPAEVEAAPIKIGTLATQDALPLWVAEERGYFADNGLENVEIVTFQSAQEEQVAFTSGSVDALMTDLIVTANLHESGTPVEVATVMLGATTEQGRFAVVAAPNSGIGSMADLKGVPIGLGSATVTELVVDKLGEEAGLSAADLEKEEVKKVPVRFELLMQGKLKAASLPEPFVSLATLSGATIPEGGDDTKASTNISQSVLTVSSEFADSEGGAAAVDAVLAAWDAAVADINADPNSFRQTLVDKARLPAPLAESYEVSQYPSAALPANEDVQMVLDWMREKGYLKSEVAPADLLGARP